jgi:hypothetical protein
MTYAFVRVPWNSEIANAACPRCGTPVDEDESLCCAHLLFIFMEGEFVFARGTVKAIIPGTDDSEDPVKEIAGKLDHALVLEFSSSFVGPGVAYGWDYSTDD